jgi:hypothetical protein
MEKIIAALKDRNMNGYMARDCSEAKELMLKLIPEGSKVSWGGSRTMEAIGIYDELRKGDYRVIDRDLIVDNKYMKNFLMSTGIFESIYLSGTNALTQDGMIVNMDGRGNRVNGIAYGPKKVIIAVGKNKIVPDLASARKRIGDMASPPNTKHLKKDTPCAKTGVCSDCRSPDRICNIFSVIEFQNDPERIHVIIIDEELGY